MAKATKVLQGTIPISYERRCQVATREDGQAFIRVWTHGKYEGWSSWQRVSEVPANLEEANCVVRLPNSDITTEDMYGHPWTYQSKNNALLGS